METYEEDDDTHYCIKCHSTINGLENYVRHRQSGCRPTVSKPSEVTHEPPSTPTTVTYPEILNADAFFSSLELQSSAKSNVASRSRSLVDRDRKIGRNEDKSKKKVRKGQETDDGGLKEKLLNMPPVVADMDDLMDHLGIPSLVGFPDIVTTTAGKSSAAASTKLPGSSSTKINNGDTLSESPVENIMPSSKVCSERKRNDDVPRVDQDHGEWLDDTILVDLDNNSENKDHGVLTSYGNYDYQQDDDSNEESPNDEIDDDDTSSNDDETEDREYASHGHTGGKWKPSELLHDMSRPNEDDFAEDDDNNEHPSLLHTGGKWKPTESSQVQRVDENEVLDKDPGASSLDTSATNSQQPLPGHTRGKWIPGAPGDLSSGYWCNPCGRKLASRLLYNRHLLSDLHARRSIQEIDGELQLPRGGAPLLLRKPASKRQRALAEIKSKTKVVCQVDNKVTRKKTRRRQKEILICEMCQARVRRPQMGKHLLSHYHCRVAGTNPCSNPDARSFILENMGNVVRQCPFQCAICRFYCNTEKAFLLHWRSAMHTSKSDNIAGSYKCSLCDFYCSENETMEWHIASSSHRDLVTMMNGSVPVIVGRERSLICETCDQRFRYNIQLIFHVRETGHRGPASVTDAYQSKMVCGLCSQVLRSQVALQRHRLSCHGTKRILEENETKIIAQQTPPYFCSFCVMNFKTAQEAVLHRRTSSHKEIVRTHKFSAEKLASMTRECPHCGSKHNSIQGYKNHLLHQHPELCHRCPRCGLLLALPQDVTRHTRDDKCSATIGDSMNRVDRAEEWRCNKCPFVTDSKAEYLFHDALHAGSIDENVKVAGSSKTPAKYRCPMCRKSFRKVTLRNHIRSHTGEKPFSCVKCKQSFTRRSTLNVHRKECAIVPSSTSIQATSAKVPRRRNHTCAECNTSFYTNRPGWKYVTYMETYKKRKWGIFWKTATRPNVRREPTVEEHTIPGCCTGFYAIRDSPLKCEPVCLSGCLNGKCTMPNTCTCDSGYRDSIIYNVNQCVPDCEGNQDDPDGCGSHGRCVAPRRCECDSGYTSPDIIYPNENQVLGLPCLPKCIPNCDKNAHCQAPNTCQCNTGYRSNSSKSPVECIPICDGECINAVCISPNTCRCLPGYEKSKTDDVACKPVCKNRCFNAKCTQPNHCECHRGYEKYSTDMPHICIPMCDPSCINGTCTRPNHCECHFGYEKSSQKLSHICSPICVPPCINAHCIEPNRCECYPDHAKTSDSQLESCSPICDPLCINAICDRPNSCKCHDGYKENPKYPAHWCSAFCEPACGTNAFCDKPNKCACNVGYIEASFANLSLINHQSVGNTVNSIVGPPGYAATTSMNNSISCQPLCEPKCIENAECVAPNVCQCDQGYRSVPQSKKMTNPLQCHPICDNNCINAYCGYPNKCICLEGYEPNFSNDFECVAFCKHDCINGKCIQPNNCECNEGYRKPELLPEATWDNRTALDNLCIPICSEKCSSCIGPNQCLCNPGYVITDTLTDSSSLYCQPLCEPSCPNGTECVEPNQCQFQSEYVKDQIESIPDSELSTLFPDIVNSAENCSNNADFFHENGTCICRYGWNGQRCDKPSLCVVAFTSDNGTDNEINKVKRVIALNNSTRESEYDELDLKHGAAEDWQGPKCSEQCRTSLFSSTGFGNISDDIIYCQVPRTSNDTNEYNSTETTTFEPETENKTIVCFLRAESKCNALKASTLKLQTATYEIVGVSLLSTLIASLGLVIYFIYVKRRKTNLTGELSMNNSSIIEWSDSYECITTSENSSLHALKQHIMRHAGKNYKCGLPGCPTILRTENELRSHRSLVHDSDNSDRKFRCNECPYAAKTKTQLRRHRTRHESPKDDKNSNRLDCPYSHCNFTTRITSHLKRHIRLHTGTKPFKCRHCTYMSNNLENLRKHVLSTSLHPGKTIYECDVCRNGQGLDPYCTNFAKELRAHLLEVHPREFPRPSDATDHVAKIFKNDRETASPTRDSDTTVKDPIGGKKKSNVSILSTKK